MKKILSIGDAFEDMFVFSNDFKIINDRFFKSGKSLSFDYGAKLDVEKIEHHTGGSAINTALAFAKMDFSPSVLSFIGNDSAADKIISELEIGGVGTDFLCHVDDNTSTSIILSSEGDRTILSYHGNKNFNDLKLAKSSDFDWIYLAPLGQGSDQLENKIVEHIAKNGTGLVWNPGASQVKIGAKSFKHLLRLCNVLILNREEALNFSTAGSSNIETVMKDFVQMGVKLVIVTDGKNGAKCFDGKVFYKIAASDDKRVDATGAGDSFASGLSSRIILECEEKKPNGYLPDRDTILEALKWGIVISGSVVGQVGANSGLLSRSEVIEKAQALVKVEAEIYNK